GSKTKRTREIRLVQWARRTGLRWPSCLSWGDHSDRVVMPEPARSRLVLIDGSGYIFRAFFALPPLTDPNGVPVGAVFGFCNMLFRLVQDMPGEQMLVVFDKGKASFRDDIYAEYKANRL